MKYDFSGYATKVGVECSDGYTIGKKAFESSNNKKVPLVWQHLHSSPSNVLGHAALEHRDDGVYAYCVFNESEDASQAKELVKHKDIDSLSIYANKIIKKNRVIIHGEIKEVSLVLAGANPGAMIDQITIAHGDDLVTMDDEAIIYNDSSISHESGDIEKDDKDDKTIGDIIDSMTEEQQDVLYYLLDEMNKEGLKETEDVKHSNLGGSDLKKNIFENNKNKNDEVLVHDDLNKILDLAKTKGMSLHDVYLEHADVGIKDINLLFPDHKTLTAEPTFISRDMEWVDGVISGVHHSPFSRIKTRVADITEDDARAKGYITGKKKKEEVFKLLKRTTDPTTIYKKQKLNRDDVIDITDFDVVTWIKKEMRMMLNEELARAILIGDGRSSSSDDKIDDNKIRPIWTDDELYSHKVELDETKKVEDIIEAIIKSRKYYKGKGSPTLYISTDLLTDMLLLKDTTGRRIYETTESLKSVLRVSNIVEVPVMENAKRQDGVKNLALKCIIVNLKDYTVGADKGGEINFFDDFDIDFNQMKYLLETRCSGCLTNPKTAVVIEQKIV